MRSDFGLLVFYFDLRQIEQFFKVAFSLRNSN